MWKIIEKRYKESFLINVIKLKKNFLMYIKTQIYLKGMMNIHVIFSNSLFTILCINNMPWCSHNNEYLFP